MKKEAILRELQEHRWRGYTFGFCERRGFTKKEGWKWSMEEMVRTSGTDTLVLPVCALQDRVDSVCLNTMHGASPDVMSEEDVLKVCRHARTLGLRIILKCMVNCRDGVWRAYIHFFDPPVPTEPTWDQWFEQYEGHVKEVAALAEDVEAEMLCVGCEMVSADQKDAHWRHLIRGARELYTGPVTYNCDKYQEDRLTWWDELDVMSSSGYYPVSCMESQFERIRQAAERAGKPFLFMECGCPSRGGSEERPNDWRFGHGLNLESQTRWYDAFFQATERHSFVRGYVLWDWPASRLYPERMGCDQDGYCTYGKPANGLAKAMVKA